MWATKVVAVAAAIGNLLNGWDSATLAGKFLPSPLAHASIGFFESGSVLVSWSPVHV